MAKDRTTFECAGCGSRSSQWSGRCPDCGAWGTLEESRSPGAVGRATIRAVPFGDPGDGDDVRISTGFDGLDRVLGGGLVPGSVILLAGEPGIGKSTLLLHVLGGLAAAGHTTLLASGEESRGQIASRAGRLGVDTGSLLYAPGRDLQELLTVARNDAPVVLAVDSIQTVRDPGSGAMPGGVAQVRGCADALVGLAKREGVTILMTGHVTKDGDLAGPRALEHAVDVVLTFDGDARSGLRVLAGGKNRFGAEGETAWFEMGPTGLTELDPSRLLVGADRVPGAAVALPQAGRRALAVEVQALVGAADGAGRRQATGLDLRRFQLVAAVLERGAGLPLGRADLFGAAAGGVRVDDPSCDLAIAAALASAATGAVPPGHAAFVGEVSLTGLVRAAPAMAQRIQAARAAGCELLFGPDVAVPAAPGLRVIHVHHVRDALAWALPPATTRVERLPA